MYHQYRDPALIALLRAVPLILFVSAASTAQTVLEEVVVTAERRAENLQDVPIALTSIAGDMVNEAIISGLADIALRTPSLKVNTFNVGEPQVFLRGIGNTSDSASADPAVGFFVDEVYVGRIGASDLELYDLDRIEVLRGPQGTLYGRNVAGGAINVYTKKPARDFEAKAGATVGNDDLTVFRAYVNGPIADFLAGKITFSKRDRDGYSKNVLTGQSLDDADNLSLRGQLLFTPSENLEVLFGVDYSDDDIAGQCRNLTRLIDPGQPFGGALVPLELAGITTPDPRQCNHSLVQSEGKEVFGAFGRIDYRFDFATVTSITSYRSSDLDWLQSLGGGDAPPGLLSVIDSAREEADQFSQELRLSSEGNERLSWIVGLYYFREDVERSENFVTGILPFPFSLFSGDVTFDQDADSESYAVFGQLTWAVLDDVSLTAGGRYSYDEKEIAQSAFDNLMDGTPAGIPLGNPLGTGVPYSIAAEDSWSEFTPRLTLDWKVTPDHMLYFTWSKGYKSGSFPSQATSAEVAATALEPETATNIEGGVKTQWFGRRLRVNASVFDINYEDLQVFQLIDLQLVAANAEEASVRGIELELAAVLTRNLTVSGNLSILDTEYDDYVLRNPNTGTIVDNSGNEMARAPENTWTLMIDYALPLEVGYTLDFNASASHIGQYFFEASNDRRSLQESVEIVDAYARLIAPGGRWDVTLWAKNLNDQRYVKHSILSTFGGAAEIYAPPRTYGVTFNWRWQ